LLRSLSWYRFGVGIADVDVIDDGINESALGELYASIAVLSDCDSYLIRWVSLILNV
jgi:hypothetical protein